MNEANGFEHNGKHNRSRGDWIHANKIEDEKEMTKIQVFINGKELKEFKITELNIHEDCTGLFYDIRGFVQKSLPAKKKKREKK